MCANFPIIARIRFIDYRTDSFNAAMRVAGLVRECHYTIMRFQCRVHSTMDHIRALISRRVHGVLYSMLNAVLLRLEGLRG